MLDISITYIYESNHLIPGLKEFSGEYNHKNKTLNYYYGDILIQTYAGDEAIEFKKQLEDGSKQKRLSKSEVTRIAARLCHVSIDKMKSGSRERDVVLARWFVWEYLSKYDFSQKKLGSIFGKDHATVHHGLSTLNDTKLHKYEEMRHEDYKLQVNKLHHRLRIKIAYE